MANVALSIAQYDTITKASAKLMALLLSMTGEGFETFENLNNSYQHDLLWIASDLASEIEKALKDGVRHG